MCTGPIHRKWPAQPRGFTSAGVPPRAQGLHTEKDWHSHVNPPPEASGHVHRAYTRKRADRGFWIQLRRRTAACTGPTHRKVPAQARGLTSERVLPRAQGVHTEKGRYRHVNSRPEAYSHLHMAYTPKSTGTATWIHVRRRTATCTGTTHRKGSAQQPVSTQGGVEQRAQGVHTAKGRPSHVDPRPEVCSHVHMANIPKRAGTAT